MGTLIDRLSCLTEDAWRRVRGWRGDQERLPGQDAPHGQDRDRSNGKDNGLEDNLRKGGRRKDGEEGVGEPNAELLQGGHLLAVQRLCKGLLQSLQGEDGDENP